MSNHISGWPRTADIVIQQAKARVPFRSRLLHLKRRLQGYETDVANDHLALEQGIEQILELLEYYGDLSGKVILELGSGWQPTIPILYRLIGAESVYLTDEERLIDWSLIIKGLSFIKENAEVIDSRLGVAKSEVISLVGTCLDGSLHGVLERLKMRYLVPFSGSMIANETIDVVCSRAVLEHISPETIIYLFRDFHRMLKPNGVMHHIIDNSDHWEHNDKRLSRVNFLRYEDMVWRLINPPGQSYQNRLRHYEYLEMIKAAGFEVMSQEGAMDEKSFHDLTQFRICRRYKDVDKQDLSILTSYVLARKCLQ